MSIWGSKQRKEGRTESNLKALGSHTDRSWIYINASLWCLGPVSTQSCWRLYWSIESDALGLLHVARQREATRRTEGSKLRETWTWILTLPLPVWTNLPKSQFPQYLKPVPQTSLRQVRSKWDSRLPDTQAEQIKTLQKKKCAAILWNCQGLITQIQTILIFMN